MAVYNYHGDCLQNVCKILASCFVKDVFSHRLHDIFIANNSLPVSISPSESGSLSLFSPLSLSLFVQKSTGINM